MTFADKKNYGVKIGFGGQPDPHPDGSYQHYNQVSEFVSTGKPGEVFEHKFNYAGFRYVLVEGLPLAPKQEDAVAMLVESDLEPDGAFECSNELFNRISRVNKWTQRSLNLGGYFVYCPHRERLGYGDGQVAAEGFMTTFGAYGFYRKWLTDWRIRQVADGYMPHVAPFAMGGGGPGWPGLLSAITWRHYLYYGDKRVLEKTTTRCADSWTTSSHAQRTASCALTAGGGISSVTGSHLSAAWTPITGRAPPLRSFQPESGF